MNNIPQSSQASLLKGYWLIFQDNDRVIAAHASTLTGQEKVFVNSQLVSKKMSLGMTSKHQFTWEESTYEVVFRISQILTGKMEFSLVKNGSLIGCFKTSFKSKATIIKIFGCAICGAVFGFIFGYFNLPTWLLLIVCTCIIGAAIAKGNNSIVINQEVP